MKDFRICWKKSGEGDVPARKGEEFMPEALFVIEYEPSESESESEEIECLVSTDSPFISKDNMI